MSGSPRERGFKKKKKKDIQSRIYTHLFSVCKEGFSGPSKEEGSIWQCKWGKRHRFQADQRLPQQENHHVKTECKEQILWKLHGLTLSTAFLESKPTPNTLPCHSFHQQLHALPPVPEHEGSPGPTQLLSPYYPFCKNFPGKLPRAKNGNKDRRTKILICNFINSVFHASGNPPEHSAHYLCINKTQGWSGCAVCIQASMEVKLISMISLLCQFHLKQQCEANPR